MTLARLRLALGTILGATLACSSTSSRVASDCSAAVDVGCDAGAGGGSAGSGGATETGGAAGTGGGESGSGGSDGGTGGTTDTGGAGGSGGMAGTGGDSGTGGDAGSGGMAGTGGSPECSTSADCRSATSSYCAGGACVGCTDLRSCADVDPLLPVCNVATELCTPCTAHQDCASGACRLSTGACFETLNRLWVSAAANCSAATGSEVAPFCTIGEALATVAAQPGTQPWSVHVAGSAVPYDLPPDASLPERPFALIGPSQGLSARLTGTPPSHLLVSGSGHDRYLARITLEAPSDDSTVLNCASGDLWLTDVVVGGGTRGLRVACDLRMRRSVVANVNGWGAEVEASGRLTAVESEIRANQGGLLTAGASTVQRSRVAANYILGGISVTAGTLTMSNSVLLQNVYAIGHIDLGPQAVANLSYVVALGEALSCSSPSSTFSIRNSIVDNVTCAGTGQVAVNQSLVAPGSESLGTGNVAVTPDEYAQIFVAHPQGDVHVRPDPPSYLLGVASRAAADLAVDFDGDPRPAVGQPDYPGIDAP